MADILYIVVPCYNEEEVLPETSRRLRAKLEGLMAAGKISERSRVLFVNDGSRDRTWELITRLHGGCPLFCGADLSRNRGHQNALLAGLMHFGLFSFWAFASITFIIGTIHSAYTVAFESFYPMLVSEGNYIKAYSVLSTLETLVLVMIPVSTFLYKTVGMIWLMLINSACFCTAAIFETQISDVEGKNGQSGSKYTFCGYMEDMKEGMRYLWTEKGLLYITLYFIFCFMATGASNVITLPYFKAGYADGEYIYMSVWGFMVLGRVLGGMMHYRLHLPEEHKFKIAVFVYVVISALEGTYLYLPLALMRLFCFLQGVLGVTSYNIRISSTQSYVPDDRKGRFNGTFLMLTTVGSLLGQLLAGMLTEIMPMRGVLSLFMGISGASAVIIMGKGRNAVKPIYNKKQ